MKIKGFLTAVFMVICCVFVLYSVLNFYAAKDYKAVLNQTGVEKTQAGYNLSLNLFKPESADAENKIIPENIEGIISESELPFYLISTLSSSDTLLNQAVFQDIRSKDYFILRSNEKNEEFQLIDVKRGYAKVLNLLKNQYEAFLIKKIDLDITKSYNNIKLNEDKVSVSRMEINEQIHNNVNNLFRMVSFSPYIQDGEIRGLKLDKFLQQEDFFNSLGFFQNDIIYGINGEKIDNFEKAMKLWESLRYSKNFEITLIRDGEIEKIEFAVGR